MRSASRTARKLTFLFGIFLFPTFIIQRSWEIVNGTLKKRKPMAVAYWWVWKPMLHAWAFLFTGNGVKVYFDDAFKSPQVVANLPFGSTAKNAEFSAR